jgi:enoyl-CoA hydratase/carnithine racemase
MSIKTTTADGVARIEIARPEKRNALSAAMYLDMAAAINAARGDTKVRSILIHGSIDVFTAGNDLEDFINDPPSDTDAPVFQFMQALGYAEKPVVAAVNGPAVGIGTTMLMHCDLVYCGQSAVFSMPFVSLGLCAEFGASYLFTLNAGYHKAAEKLLLGDPISPDEAVEMKLVNRVLPSDQVLTFALRQAERFNSLPPASVRETKRLMKLNFKRLVEQVVAAESSSFTLMLRSQEAKEAFDAFFARRKPDFSKFA